MLFSFRIRLLSVLIVLSTIVFVGKLFFLQVIHGDDFNEKARAQYISPVANIFDRGTIFLKGKDEHIFSAATLKSGYTVAINPAVLKEARTVFQKLSEIIPQLDSDSFFLKAGKIEDPYEEIVQRISEEMAEKVRNLNIGGVSVHREQWRFYPGGTQAAHLLGFVGYDGNERKGRYGLEQYYDDVLSRSGDKRINLFAEAFANIQNSLFYDNKHALVGDITLTIDPEVQSFVEDAIQSAVKEWNAKGGGALIMDPKTGKVLSLGAFPTFDPNNFSSEKDFSVFSNPLVESVFEMGSTVKPLTIASGLDAGVIKPEDTYVDTGTLVLNNATIGNYDGKARGRVPMQEILNQSLNTGAVYVAQKLGNRRFSDYFFSFGLGEPSGIDLPNEVASLTNNLKSTRDIEIATASFGQGFAVTPVVMARALSALANGGVLVTPYVVERIDYEERLRPYIHETKESERRVISNETSEQITRMLVEVVDKALLGGKVKMQNHSIAAKTGTAQIARTDGRGYYDDRYLHTFFGYFPAYDPQFLIFLYLLEPKGVRFSSETLTRPFIDTVNFLIHYYNMPPDR